MDIIFYNGRINTLDDTGSVHSAVGVTAGKITALGSDDELRGFSSPKTKTIDLKGAVMFPGFMEAHNHLTIYGYLLDGIDLSPSNARKIDDILSLVKAETEKTPPGTWIKGSRYAEYFLAENRHPTKNDLDRVSPKHPVILYHTSFHACALNSMALENIGITSQNESPQGGIIEKDPDTGEPTGVLHDQAMLDVFNKLFFADLEAMGTRQRVELCGKATENYATLGLVFAGDALVEPQTLNMYQETLAAGRLKIR
ncbi:MAG: amidohydrolase family protein, partial [Desulfobacterales bacterium]